MALKRRLSRRAADDDDDDDDEHEREHDAVVGRDPSPLPAKRHRAAPPDRLGNLSDELFVRILSFFDERQLLDVSHVSRRFHRIASDSQLWRPHYFRRFVLPRVNRVPGFRAASTARHPNALAAVDWERRRRGFIAAAVAADSAGALGDNVDWKQQYKLRHNWAGGRCTLDHVDVQDADPSPSPNGRTLVRVVEGLAITAHVRTGLRAWNLRTRKIITFATLATDLDPVVPPTCLALDDQRLATAVVDISVGFDDGTFGVWRLDVAQAKLTLMYRQTKCHLGRLLAVAYRYPFVLTASSLGYLSLYSFGSGAQDDDEIDAAHAEPTPSRETAAATSNRDSPLPEPHQLTSLHSHSTRMPLALSLRKAAASVVASIAFTYDSYEGWAIGIQDLDIHQPAATSMPVVAGSRVAFTLSTPTRKLATPPPESTPTPSPADSIEGGPVQLCYSHPYLLATLPDNCMVLHLCTSTATSLTVSPGIRLWGHTSGISDAGITSRGKAVSISTRGDEIRLWELEGRVGGNSVEVRPTVSTDGTDDTNVKQPDYPDLMEKKTWVGFDNEMIVVLKETEDGKESLAVYDFS